MDQLKLPSAVIETQYISTQMQARYALPVNTAHTYGPYLRPVYTGAFLTLVHTARIGTGVEKCTRVYGPYIPVTGRHYLYIRPVHTDRIYG